MNFIKDLTFKFNFALRKIVMKQILIRQKQIIFFIIAGGLSAVVELLAMKFFSLYVPQFFPQEINFHGIKYPISNILSTSLAILFNYYLSIKFVFERGKHGRKREFVYFMVVSGMTTLLSLIFFQLFINFVFLQPIDFKIYPLSPIILSKFMAIGLVSILNYFVKKKVIFKG